MWWLILIIPIKYNCKVSEIVMMAYRRPLYYEIAFSSIDPKKQVNLFEKFIEKYSKRKVKRFLDICCGPSFQLREIAKRGYEAVGLDSSPQMLEYLRKRAKEERIRIETTKGDMVNFRLKKKVDFAFIMMSTISYLKSNREVLSHLDSVAHSLNRGGLYLIENFPLDWSSKEYFTPLIWAEKRNGIGVKSTHNVELKDSLNQIAIETLILEVNDEGKKSTFKHKTMRKLVFPAEFLTLLELNKKFEFMGWFEPTKPKKLTKASFFNMGILRKR